MLKLVNENLMNYPHPRTPAFDYSMKRRIYSSKENQKDMGIFYIELWENKNVFTSKLVFLLLQNPAPRPSQKSNVLTPEITSLQSELITWTYLLALCKPLYTLLCWIWSDVIIQRLHHHEQISMHNNMRFYHSRHTLRKDFVILQLYWLLFSSTKHCSWNMV